ncbi:MAG: hypothetical protein ACHQZS_12340, partial [Candidatus Binatales bacterium]
MINPELCGATYVRRLTSVLMLCCLLAVSASALSASRRGAPPPAASAELLAQIRVLDNRPAPFALDARSAIMVAAHTGAV